MCTAETFAVVAIDYHPSGRLLATADGHRVPLWDAATGDCQSVIEPAHGAQALAFSPDGSRLAIGGSRLTIVDPSTGVADAGRVTFPADRLIVWAPDGRGVLSASKDGWIHVHDTPGLAERFRLRCRTPGGTGRLAWSPDSSFIATWMFRQIDLWDARDGRHLCAISTSDLLEDVALSSDGREVVGTSVTGVVSFWNVATGALVRSYRLSNLWGAVSAMAWSLDTRSVAVVTQGAVVLADARDGAEMRRFDLYGGFFYSDTGRVVFNPDGSALAVGVGHSNPGILALVWDLATGRPLWALRNGTPARGPVRLAVQPAPELPPVPLPSVAAVRRAVTPGARVPDGEAVWSRRFRADEDHSPHDLAVSASGEILLLGSAYHRVIDFGPPLGQLSVDDFQQGHYLLTMDGDGASLEAQGLRWRKSVTPDPARAGEVIDGGGTSGPSAMRLVLESHDRLGDILLARHLRESPHGQGLAVQLRGVGYIGLSAPAEEGSASDPAGSLERLTRALDLASTTVLQGAWVEECAINRDGSVAMTGYFHGNATLGGVELKGVREARFLAKLSPEGQVSYAKPLDEGWHVRIALAPGGKLFVAGGLIPGADLGDGPVSPDSFGKPFLAKLDGAGSVLWMNVFAGSGGVTGMTITPEGGVLLAGALTGSLDLGLGPLAGAGSGRHPTPYLARFGPRGTALWSRRFGDGDEMRLTAVRIVDLDHAVVCGATAGDLDLGAGPMPRSRRSDTFVAKIVY